MISSSIVKRILRIFNVNYVLYTSWGKFGNLTKRYRIPDQDTSKTIPYDSRNGSSEINKDCNGHLARSEKVMGLHMLQNSFS